MLPRPWLLVFLFIALASSSHAQQVDASNTGGPTSLDAPWRLHFGDDPAYAQPGFDDSQWILHRIAQDWASAGRKGYSGYAWYRTRVILPKGNEPLAIAIYPPATIAGVYIPASVVEVYMDGALAGTIGCMRPEPVVKWLRPAYSVAVPAELNGRPVELALRVWLSPLAAPFLYAGAAAHPPLVGTAGDVSRIVSLEQQNFRVASIPVWIDELSGICVGLFSFGLFLLQRQAREYAWAAVFFLSGCLVNWLFPIAVQSDAGFRITLQVAWTAYSVGLISLLLFTWGFVGARADRLLRVCIAVACGDALGITLVNLGLIPYAGLSWIYAPMHGFLAIAVFARLYTLARRGKRDAQLLLIPFFLFWGVFCVQGVVDALASSGIADFGSALVLYHNPLFDILWSELFEVLSYFAIGAVLVLRFTRSAKQEQRLRSEMEAARTVQQMLVPEEIPSIPGFSIQAVYQPAGQVGGDFYQVLPAPNGGLLAVIGDVSGKGMPAAMTVSLLVGTVRTLAHYTQDPAGILTAMNERMIGRGHGGFTTALVLRLDPDGTLTAANAGHIAPYANGKELEIDNGLPLGITAAAAYINSTLHLESDTTLTLLTDGVVEAQNDQGELFGFERAAEISSKPAQKVAEAARTFGQQDDITVLSLAWVVGG